MLSRLKAAATAVREMATRSELRVVTWLTAVAAPALTSLPANAQLPAPIDPKSGTAAAGDFIEFTKFTMKDILLIAGTVLITVAFIWVSYSAFAKFNQARMGRAEWSEVFVTAGVAAVLLVFGAFMVNQSTTVIT